jgi:hypothetical protein
MVKISAFSGGTLKPVLSTSKDDDDDNFKEYCRFKFNKNI